MLENLKNYRIVLASNSPRRKELLTGLGIDYSVRLLPDIDESYPPHLKEGEIARHIACQKAAAYRSSLTEDELLITADTIVWLQGGVLGKPEDKADARRMLHLLSDNKHQVYTGVCLTTRQWQKNFVSTSHVWFDKLEDEEIERYVEAFSPLDKAGAYGIQEWIGFIGVKSIEGSFYNIMGLPIQRLYQELKTIRP